MSRIQSLVASHLTRNWTTIPHVTRHDDADIEALDTPNGLLAPVIRDADQKSIEQIAEEITALSQQARSRGLPLDRMTGGCFTLSSLGGIGGTGFTPIINAPEIAIRV